MSNTPLTVDDITLTTQLQQEQDILKIVEAKYVNNNARIIDKIQKLEDAVIGLIKEKENTTGFTDVHDNIIKETIKKMKSVAEQHKKFIDDNKKDQIASVSSSKGEDIFLLGADMLQRIENITEHNTIQVQLKNKYPIKNITENNLNVRSGGEYRSFTKDKLETQKKDAQTDINYKHFYDNITGFALLNSKQAMLIALYAALNNIDIVTNYGDVFAKLKAEGIMDYKTDSNLTIKPIKNPKGTSPLMVGDNLVDLTVGFEFGGKRNTAPHNDKKDAIHDTSSIVEYLFSTGTLTTTNMIDAISEGKNNDFRKNVLTKATQIIKYNNKNNTNIMGNLKEGDMLVGRAHVSFVKIIDGKPHMLSYTRDRGEGPDFKDVNKRTDENFKEKRINIDGFVLEDTASFEKLIKQKNPLYVIKLDLNKKDTNIPEIVEYQTEGTYATNLSNDRLNSNNTPSLSK